MGALYISQSTHMLMLCINAYSFHSAAGGLPRPDKAVRGGGVGVWLVHLQLLSSPRLQTQGHL